MFDQLKSLLVLVASGFGGAIVSLSLHKENRSATQVIIFLLSGAATAIFVTPWLAHRFGLTDAESISALSFAVGCGWQSVASKILDWMGSGKTPSISEEADK